MVGLLRVLAVLVIVLVPWSDLHADDDAGAFVDRFAQQAISLATDSGSSEAERRAQFGALLEEFFDMPAIGRFLLGRYWRSTSPEDREAYLQAFTDNIVYTYSKRFDDYTGQKLVIDDVREDGRFEIVTSRIVDPNSPQSVRLDWRVIETAGTFKIIDVVIEGVSMSVTQRQEYASVIQNNGGQVTALIDALNRQMATLRGDG